MNSALGTWYSELESGVTNSSSDLDRIPSNPELRVLCFQIAQSRSGNNIKNEPNF